MLYAKGDTKWGVEHRRGKPAHRQKHQRTICKRKRARNTPKRGKKQEGEKSTKSLPLGRYARCCEKSSEHFVDPGKGDGPMLAGSKKRAAGRR